MHEKPTAVDIEADDAALAAEADAIIAMIEGAGPGDVLAVLNAMAAALEPGDDPRLVAGVRTLRRILGLG